MLGQKIQYTHHVRFPIPRNSSSLSIVAVRFGDKDFAALERYAAKDRRAVSTVVWMIVTDQGRGVIEMNAPGRLLQRNTNTFSYRASLEQTARCCARLETTLLLVEVVTPDGSSC